MLRAVTKDSASLEAVFKELELARGSTAIFDTFLDDRFVH